MKRREHKHILVAKAKILQRKEHGFRDESIYSCERCHTEFVPIPSYESQVPK